jgi:cation diffusion facilitator CzcD-associated flavoprotein CzcO
MSSANGDTPPLPEEVDVLVVGAGFSGLGTAIKLKEHGHHDFVVIERGDDVGGTWHFNTYPNCGCDVPSHLYSFSFAPNPDWTRTYSKQPEIRDYLQRTADEFGIRPHVRTNTTVESAAWDEDTGRWTVSTDRGDVRARMLVAGMGPWRSRASPTSPAWRTSRAR